MTYSDLHLLQAFSNAIFVHRNAAADKISTDSERRAVPLQ